MPQREVLTAACRQRAQREAPLQRRMGGLPAKPSDDAAGSLGKPPRKRPGARKVPASVIGPQAAQTRPGERV